MANIMSNGWIKIYRELADSDLWKSEKFTKGQAWVDMNILTNHKAGSFWVRGNKLQLERGQLGMSELTMAARWRWSRNKVRRFLNWLETEQLIKQQKKHITSIITIINYGEEQKPEQQTRQQTIQQKDNRRNTNKNNKNDKNIKEKNIIKKEKTIKYLNEFLEFKALFPRKEAFGGIHGGEGAWNKAIALGYDPKKIIAGLKRNLSHLEEQHWKKETEGRSYCPLPATWLNQKRWEDEPCLTRKTQTEFGRNKLNKKLNVIKIGGNNGTNK